MQLKRMSDKNDTFLCKEHLTDTILILAGPEFSQWEKSCLSYSASKEDFVAPNLSHHIKLCTEDAVCCLHGTACLSQLVKCTLKLGAGHPKHWQ